MLELQPDQDYEESRSLKLSNSTYKVAGVNLDAMEGLKDRLQAFAAITHGPEVLDAGGSVAGLFQLGKYHNPVLVASTDGVGTKLKIAVEMGHYESIGQDLVTLNVNDILTRGAKPLFFLDYVAFSALDEQRMESLMRGISWGCKEVGCALIGGETAQMPGLYSGDDFDLAGFVVGAVERDQVLHGTDIKPGDYLLGIPSSGLHTNGFSLVRRVFGIDDDPSVLFRYYQDLKHQLGEELLIRHRCYHPLLEPIMGLIKGVAHITGGGLPGKMPAILPDSVVASFQKGTWSMPPIFPIIQRDGGVSEEEMYRVFNMGLGMVAVCEEEVIATIQDAIPDAQVVGQIVNREGDQQVVFA